MDELTDAQFAEQWGEKALEVRNRQREEPWGKLLVKYGYEPYDTESAARHVATMAADEIAALQAEVAKLRGFRDRLGACVQAVHDNDHEFACKFAFICTSPSDDIQLNYFYMSKYKCIYQVIQNGECRAPETVATGEVLAWLREKGVE